MAYCPRFKSYRDVQQWLERIGAEMARKRGLPPPKVGFYESIYVKGERWDVGVGLYDFGTETIILHPREVRKVLEPTSFTSWRFGILRHFYHEFAHHEQYHRADRNWERAFNEVEIRKPWVERRHEKEAEEEARKMWDKFDRTLDPLGELERGQSIAKRGVSFLEKLKASPELIEEMKKGSLESLELHREMGYLLCEVEERLIPGTLCRGEACRVFVEDCPQKAVLIGSFHTHPFPSGRPHDVLSRGDLFSSFVEKDEKIACVGSAILVLKPRPPKPPEYGAIIEIFCVEPKPETTKEDVKRLIEELGEYYHPMYGLDSEKYEEALKPYFRMMRLEFEIPKVEFSNRISTIIEAHRTRVEHVAER